MSDRSTMKRGIMGFGAAVVACFAVAVAFEGRPAGAAPVEVTNTLATGPGSLADAVATAEGTADADVITFQTGLTGTIALTSTLSITKPLTITGPSDAVTGGGVYDIVVDATAVGGPIFEYTSGAGLLDVSGLELANASTEAVSYDAPGGQFTLSDVLLRDNGTGVIVSRGDQATIQDTVITGHTNSAITIGDAVGGTGVPDIDIHRVTVDNGGAATVQGNGIQLTYVTTVDITDTTVTDQNGDGITIDTGHPTNAAAPEAVTITDVVATGNSGSGLFVDDVNGPVAITDLVATGNTEQGLDVLDVDGAVDVTGTDTDLSGNDQEGGRLRFVGPVTFTDVAANDNTGEGLRVTSADSLTATRTEATGNGIDGLYTSSVTGPIVISGGTFDDNGTGINDDGLEVSSLKDTLQITGVSAQNNGGRGIFIDGVTSTAGDVTLDGATTVSGNGTSAPGRVGLQIRFGDIISPPPSPPFTGPDVSISDITVTGNPLNAHIFGAKDVTVTDSAFDDSTGVDFQFVAGLTVSGAVGDVEISGSSFDDNGDVASADNVTRGLIVTPHSLTNGVRTPTSLTIVDSTANDNNGSGFDLEAADAAVRLGQADGESAPILGITATGNGGDGVRVPDAGRVDAISANLASNDADGLHVVEAAGILDDDIDPPAVVAVVASGGAFNGNGDHGIDLQKWAGTAAIVNTQITDNTTGGVLAGDNADLVGNFALGVTTVSDNPFGVHVRKADDITIFGSEFSGHDQRAIQISGGGAGSEVGDVVVGGIGGAATSSTTVDNGETGSPLPTRGTGVFISGVESVDISDLDVTKQADSGLTIDQVSGTVDIVDSTLTYNDEFGIDISDVVGETTIARENVETGGMIASDNGRSGISLLRTGDVTMDSVVTSDNTERGLFGTDLGTVSITESTAIDNGTVGIGINGTTGNVTFTGGDFTNPLDGIVLQNVGGTAEFSDVTATGNGDDGIVVGAGASPVRIVGGSHLDDNGQRGADLQNVGAVTVTDSQMNGNADQGLRAITTAGITVTGSEFVENGSSGVVLFDVAGKVTANTSLFRANDGNGLWARDVSGKTTIDGSTFDANVIHGADLGSPAPADAVGNISSSGASFTGNGEVGLRIANGGNVTVADATITGNHLATGPGGAAAPPSQGAGVDVDDTGKVTLTRATITGNGGIGGFLEDIGDLAITDGDISSNPVDGLNGLGGGNVTITGSTASNNTGDGVRLHQFGVVDVSGVQMDGNGDHGIDLDESAGIVTIDGSSFADNEDAGVNLQKSAEPMTVSDSTFSGNRIGVQANLTSAAVTVIGSEVTGSAGSSVDSGVVFSEVDALATVDDTTITDTATCVRSTINDGNTSIVGSTLERCGDHAVRATDIGGSVSVSESSISDFNRGLVFETITGSATVDRSAIGPSGGSSGIVASSDGAIRATDVDGGLLVVNSSVFDVVSSGALIDATGSDLRVAHSTLDLNIAFAMVRGDTSIDVDHSIVMASGSDESIVAVTPSGGSAPTVTASYSILTPGTGLGGTTIEGSDAQLDFPALNGGPTRSMRPRATSPAVDAGDPSISGAPPTDQPGNPRIAAIIDIGAVERVPTAVEPLSPERFADTRPTGVTLDGEFEAAGKVGGGEEYRVVIAGRGSVPDSAVGAVMNVTAVAAEGTGFVTVHPCVAKPPNASSLNYTAGVNLGNEIIAGLTDDGAVCLFTSQAAHLTIDVTGYIPAGSTTRSLTPTRYLDTRAAGDTFDDVNQATGKTTAGGTTIVQIAGRGAVPADAASVIVNVTAVNAPGTGFVTVHPCVDPLPVAASLNHVVGVNRGNELVAPLDASGRICIFTSSSIDLTADVVGYVPAGSTLGPVEPARLLDTRLGAFTVDGENAGEGRLDAGETYRLQVTGRAGVPDGASAAVVNVTAIGAVQNGFVTVHPCLVNPPNTSALNYVVGVNGGNEIITTLTLAAGELCLYTAAPTHLSVDIVGYIE